jgi:pimeloyl-ACP methyl ester carboxylesterase
MTTTHNGDYELYFETAGSPDGVPLLLVGGFGAQLVSWQDGFVDALVDRGWFVVTMDNRDVGLSTKTQRDQVAYTLSDMAADAVAVIDAVDVERAHVFGTSMGGMIAQTIAIEHPARVATLISVMSTTGNRAVGQPTPEALAALTRPSVDDRDEFVANYVAGARVYGGPRFDEAWTTERARREFDRSYHPAGLVHQMRAIMATGDRTDRLRSVTTPTLVIHGGADTLIPLDGGEATAAAIPGAHLVVFEEMGHNLPVSYWPAMFDAIARAARR